MAGVSVVVKAVLLWRRQSALMAVAPKWQIQIRPLRNSK
jgi:hypothetical protein